MISLACRVWGSAPDDVTCTVPPPASRALPLIQSILFFLKRNSTPLVSPVTTLVRRALTRFMSIDGLTSPSTRPHSFASCAIFRAWACSSSAFVGMQPQLRHVPPSDGWRSTTAVLRPSCAARIAATYPPVPAPITTTSYSCATRVCSCRVPPRHALRRLAKPVGQARYVNKKRHPWASVTPVHGCQGLIRRPYGLRLTARLTANGVRLTC